MKLTYRRVTRSEGDSMHCHHINSDTDLPILTRAQQSTALRCSWSFDLSTFIYSTMEFGVASTESVTREFLAVVLAGFGNE